jgi:subtilisin family serine protease
MGPAMVTNIAALPGMQELWRVTQGDPRIRVALLDGPVDRSHPCFREAQLTALPTLVSEAANGGRMSAHGTHIASMIFGRPGSLIRGIAPACHGFIAPIFSDASQGPASQLDLARAINQAVEAGAQVINVSGGELSNISEADPMLVNAVRFCNDQGALIVAAAGNDSCRCLHVPAALPSVLAVGAMDAQGLPLDSSNWGDVYQTQGILAPGQNMLGAIPGGGTTLRSGTSFATPVVTGVVALLLSLQLARGIQPEPHAVREAILASAIPCNQELFADCQRWLAGRLNIPGAYNLISKGRRIAMSAERAASDTLTANDDNPFDSSSAVGVAPQEEPVRPPGNGAELSEGVHTLPKISRGPAVTPSAHTAPGSQVEGPAPVATNGIQSARGGRNGERGASVKASSVAASACACQDNGSKSLVFALGTLGYDFGTEARRDGFKSLMPNVFGPDAIPYVYYPGGPSGDAAYPANPYDPRQMVNYLAGFPPPQPPFPTEGGIQRFDSQGSAFPKPISTPPQGYPGSQANLWDAANLIWTLNIELTPIYALRPRGEFTTVVYQRLVEFLAGQVRSPVLPSGEDDQDFVSRVSIPGHLTGETVQLFSGQVVPVLEPQVRGMFAWNENALVNAVISKMKVDYVEDLKEFDDALTQLQNDLRQLLNDLKQLQAELKQLQDAYDREQDPIRKEEIKANIDQKNADIDQKKKDIDDKRRAIDEKKAEKAQFTQDEPGAEARARDSLRQFLDRIYYDLRNLGQSAPERALNYAATNAFQGISIFGDPASAGLDLDRILVERSSFCRKDSDCWDVKLRFFDPANVLKARLVDRFTVDVSDTYPVLVGPVRKWYEPG